MESDAYIWGFTDYTELACMVSRSREGVYVWDTIPDSRMSQDALTMWARDYICGWQTSKDQAEAYALKSVSERPKAA